MGSSKKHKDRDKEKEHKRKKKHRSRSRSKERKHKRDKREKHEDKSKVKNEYDEPAASYYHEEPYYEEGEIPGLDLAKREPKPEMPDSYSGKLGHSNFNLCLETPRKMVKCLQMLCTWVVAHLILTVL